MNCEHKKYTESMENLGRNLFLQHFNTNPLWANSTYTPEMNQFSNFDLTVMYNQQTTVLIEVKCRIKENIQNKSDIWIAQNKIDWFKRQNKPFMICFIEPIHNKMYVINRKNIDKWYKTTTWKMQKNYPDPKEYTEFGYCYYKANLECYQLLKCN